MKISWIVVLFCMATFQKCHCSRNLKATISTLSLNDRWDDNNAESIQYLQWSQNWNFDRTVDDGQIFNTTQDVFKKNVDINVQIKLDRNFDFIRTVELNTDFGSPDQWFYADLTSAKVENGPNYRIYNAIGVKSFQHTFPIHVESGENATYTIKYNVTKVSKQIALLAEVTFDLRHTSMSIAEMYDYLKGEWENLNCGGQSPKITDKLKCIINGSIRATTYYPRGHEVLESRTRESVSMGNGPYGGGGVFPWRLCLLLLGAVIGIAIFVTLAAIAYKRHNK